MGQTQTAQRLDRQPVPRTRPGGPAGSKAVAPVKINSGVRQVQLPNNEPNSTLFVLTPNLRPQTKQPQQSVGAGSSRPLDNTGRPRILKPPAEAVSVASKSLKPVAAAVVAAPAANNANNKNPKKSARKTPAVKLLAKRFRANGLGLLDSYFNAYYFYYNIKSEKKGRKYKSELRTMGRHPKGWAKNRADESVYEKNEYDKNLAFLAFVARLWGFICLLLSPARRFFKSISGFFAACGNSSKASKNIAYIAKKACAVLIPAASVILTFMAVTSINAFKPSLELTFNGQVMGFVDSKETVARVVSILENSVSSVLDEPYEFNGELSYRIVLVKESSRVSEGALYTAMYNSPQTQDVVAVAYGLYIDEELIVAAENEGDISRVLNEVLLANMSGEDGEIIEFANDIKIIESIYPKKSVVTQEELKDIINYSAENHGDSQVAGISTDSFGGYEIFIDDPEIPLWDGSSFNFGNSGDSDDHEPGEDLALLAAAAPISLTPEAINTLPRSFLGSGAAQDENGQTLQEAILSRLTRGSEGSLQFKKIKTESYNIDVPFDVKYIESNQYFTGTQTLRTPGVNGVSMVTADVTYIGDKEVSREIKTTEVIKEPVAKVVINGTKPKPQAGPTGGFIRPIKGGYYTTRFSSKHRGLDIAVGYGTPILAADGGTVIYSGTSGSYGKHVKIRHSDGFVTLYAHMSSIGVSSGDKVFQGQEIGKVGSTGNSTGNHLHFEIIKNGVQVNPEAYY